MRRSLGLGLLVVFALLCSAAEASAVPFSSPLSAQGSDFGGSFSPDLIVMSLPTSGTVTFSTTAPSGFSAGGPWTYTVYNGGFNATLDSTTYLTGQTDPVSWFQNFDGPTGEYSFDLDWSLFQRDASGSITRFDAGTTSVAVAIPEPSTLMILGLGALGAAVQARRRRTTQSAAI